MGQGEVEDGNAVGDQRGKLLERFVRAARSRYLQIRTERIYWGWIKRFVAFHGMRRPEQMGSGEVEAFLIHLAAERSVAESTLNQAMSALLFDLPEADMGCHPTDGDGPPSGTPSISFYCDDIEETVAELQRRGVEFVDEVSDAGCGLTIHYEVPGGFAVELYQPHYSK